MKVTEKVEEEERRKAQLRESQVALSKKLEELRIQSRSTAREGLMLRHQVSYDHVSHGRIRSYETHTLKS